MVSILVPPITQRQLLIMKRCSTFMMAVDLMLHSSGLAQLDQFGNVNVSQFGPKVVGPGGFINISQSSKKVVFMGQFTVGSKEKFEDNQLVIVDHGRGKKIVNNVEQITFSGEYASKAGIPVLYVTERAVFDVVDGRLRLIEIAPGVDLGKRYSSMDGIQTINC